MFAPDFITAKHLQQELSTHCELHSTIFCPCWLTDAWESTDLALLNGMYHSADAGYSCLQNNNLFFKKPTQAFLFTD